MRLSSYKVAFLRGRLPVRLSSISNPPYKGLVRIFSLNFKFRYFPGVAGGWRGSGENKIKASLISAELELGMSLAKCSVEIFDLG